MEETKMAKNRNVEAMISAAGFITALISNLLTEVERLGGSAEDLHRLVNPEGKTLVTQIAWLIVGAERKVEKTFEVILHSSLTFDETIQIGNYVKVDPTLNKENFPLDKIVRVDEEIYLRDFNLNEDEVKSKLLEEGLVPANISHASAFCPEYHEELKKYSIIFMGSPWSFNGVNYYPTFFSDHAGKIVATVGNWKPHFIQRVAAVRIPNFEKSFTVKFEEPLDYNELIIAGCYGKVDRVTSELFETMHADKSENEVFIFHYNVPKNAISVIFEMDKAGFKPASSIHGLAFGKQYPAEQKKHEIVFLGNSQLCSREFREFLALSSDVEGRRIIKLEPEHIYYYASTRFAAVRK
jgi:hypothetical protein